MSDISLLTEEPSSKKLFRLKRFRKDKVADYADNDDDSIQSLQAIIAWVKENKMADSRLAKEMTHDHLTAMLAHCEESMVKSQQIITSNQIEMKNYEQLHQKIEQGIQEANKQVNLCKSQAINKTKKGNLLNPVNPGRSNSGQLERRQTLEKLNLLEADIKRMQAIKDNLNGKLNNQRRQFQSLLSAAHQLHTLIAENEANYPENKASMSKQSGVDFGRQLLLTNERLQAINRNAWN
ncbi:THO complex subunit 7 -like protein [Halotydeus destructor]|nr:THO complex subunit 7 -like protein [Halotydeus destructor]